MSSKIAIILSGGVGSRMNLDQPKQYIEIDGKMIIDHSIDKLKNIVDDIVIVCDKQYNDLFSDYICVEAGKERYESLQNAMEYVKQNYDEAICITHDSARPYFDSNEIKKMIIEYKNGTVLSLCKRATSTFVYKDEIINRDELLEILTPQIVDVQTYFKSNIINDNMTDLISYAKINNIETNYFFTEMNIKKITYKDDLK